MARLGESGSVETILALLREALLAERLAEAIWVGAETLTQQMKERAAAKERELTDEEQRLAKLDLNGDGVLDPEELQASFEREGAFELVFADPSKFFGGLAGLVGLPHEDLYQGMLEEHTKRVDATTLLMAPNYKTRTCSKAEFWFVVEPTPERLKEIGLRYWPRDMYWGEQVDKSRQALPVDHFEPKRALVDAKLAAVGEQPVAQLEFFSARLYTGPM